MRTSTAISLHARVRTALWLPLAALVVGCAEKPPIKVAVDTTQLTFLTPAEAGEALRAAAKLGDRASVVRILGPVADSLLAPDDSAQAIESMRAYSKKYDQMHRWVTMRDSTLVLHIGADNFPFPVPLAHVADARWGFDAYAGIEELRARRIGRNELLAMDACTSIANAEELYQKQAHGENPKGVYTPRILGSPDKQDGLHWESPEDQPLSPLGRLGDFASKAVAQDGPDAPPIFDGYAFRILTSQGKSARGGARNYVVNGKMTGGFAVLATPVSYAESGIMTFMLSREGTLYEKDLGPGNAAAAITEYDPADGWTSVPTN